MLPKMPDVSAPEKQLNSEVLVTDVSTIRQCIEHEQTVIAKQLERIKDKGYDFAPEFQGLTIQL
mgnify:CR=1 FL=1